MNDPPTSRYRSRIRIESDSPVAFPICIAPSASWLTCWPVRPSSIVCMKSTLFAGARSRSSMSTGRSGYVDGVTTAGPDLVAGRYRVTEPLGQGGMGRVWLARDVVLNRDVAVKEVVLPPDVIALERDALRRRTLREA